MDFVRTAGSGLSDYVKTTFSTPGRDFLASIVVFLVALPLCMGIAIASGVPVSAGLITGIVGGLIVGAMAGAPLQVSGPAAGLTVIVVELVQKHGLEMLGLAVLIGGVLQFAAGLCKLGQWFRAVSPAVVQGMLAGIGVLIFASQFHVMVDDRPKSHGVENLASIPEAIWKGLPLPTWTSAEERSARIALLKDFGALHERQVQIHESVDEQTDIVAGSVGELAGLPESQRAVVDRLDELDASTAKLVVDQPDFDPHGTFRAALAGSLKSSRAALAELEAASKPEAATEDESSAAIVQARRLADTQRAAEASLSATLYDLKDHAWAAKLGMLAIAILILWQVAAPKALKLLPGALIAVVTTSVLAAVFVLPVLYVEAPSNLFSEIHVPTIITVSSVSWIDALQLGLVIAIVASAETLLCATAVDRLQSEVKTDYDRELAAQGVGNMICGFLGALPMTGVIVRSAANVQAGAKTRLSSVLHGLWILIFVSFLVFLLQMIPIAALAAILVYTGYKLVNFKAIKDLWKHGKWEVFVYVATAATVVVEDLLTGVVVGVVLSALRLLFTFSRLNADLEIREGSREAVLHLSGAATFLRLPILANKLDEVPPGVTLHVDLDGLEHIDHACLDLLKNWNVNHEKSGGKMLMDWDDLHETFKHGPSGKAGNGNGHSNGKNGKSAKNDSPTSVESPESLADA